MLHVFSSVPEILSYGVEHYKVRSFETTSLLYDLLVKSREENPSMPDALEEFARQTIDRLLKELPLKKRLEGLSPEQRLEGLSPEQLLEGLSPENREAMLRLLTGNKASGGKG
jgi:hypothetical protein